ncbi:hypothetical protein VOLCADRAFT_96857 [Volvox carteri f. nagariensis]|uniref:Uncharacterized protein n=1 Tax=Volvox carteri f. nagariensis TaxID=3068 RepID=D8UB88_VOLCA|nr:uncharacterized protein VOLCADRAFT_96857 [Volvox carteri f. nagariensis]EFJ43127.1 hypothetical protein VOLCADRAFT_96857 [Volvox carteri f. nagariensis]|eukprot:XP_002955926.1 hypothetical protein VOLCADRAFT_96857 [Volvox carteri f. nagariensis]
MVIQFYQFGWAKNELRTFLTPLRVCRATCKPGWWQPIFISTSRQQPYAAHPKQPGLQAAQPQPTFTDGGSKGGTSDSRGKEDDFIEFQVKKQLKGESFAAWPMRFMKISRNTD